MNLLNIGLSMKWGFPAPPVIRIPGAGYSFPYEQAACQIFRINKISWLLYIFPEKWPETATGF